MLRSRTSVVIQDIFYQKQSTCSSEYEDEEVSDEDDTDGLTVIGAGGIQHVISYS